VTSWPLVSNPSCNPQTLTLKTVTGNRCPEGKCSADRTHTRPATTAFISCRSRVDSSHGCISYMAVVQILEPRLCAHRLASLESDPGSFHSSFAALSTEILSGQIKTFHVPFNNNPLRLPQMSLVTTFQQVFSKGSISNIGHG